MTLTPRSLASAWGLGGAGVLLFLLGIQPAVGDDVICLVAPEGHDYIQTVDCDYPEPHAWDSEGRGYATEGTPCGSDVCSTITNCICPRPRDPLCYLWSVSSSATNPEDSVGELPIGQVDLFLWWKGTCGYGYSGIAAAEMDVQVTGVEYVSFHPMNGVLSAGTMTSLLLAVGGCPVDPLLVGRFEVVNDPSPVDSETWGRIKSFYR